MGYWYKADFSLVRGDDFTLTQTWSLNGSPVDISSWVFSFEANEVSTRASSPGNIVIGSSAIVKSDSGSGTTDTISIPFSDTDTAVTVGRYKYDIKAEIGSDTVTVARGTLVIKNSEQ